MKHPLPSALPRVHLRRATRMPHALMQSARHALLVVRRHQAIERLVGDKLDSHAQLFVRVALGFSSGSEAEQGIFDGLFTVDDLLAKCPSHFADDGTPITWQLVCNYLDAMCADPLCTIASTLNDKYVLKLAELGNAIHQLVLEEVVKEKVGEAGCRLFRILLRRHTGGGCSSRGQQKLELKQLAELALLPERDARPLLLRLLQEEYVMLQEVPRTVDRNPKTTTYLWHVSLPHAYATLEQEMHRMLVSLHRRLAHEAAAAAANGSAEEALRQSTGSIDTGVGEAGLAARRAEFTEMTLLKLHETMMLLRNV
jgi:transcription initiation factor IIE alpha subunit